MMSKSKTSPLTITKSSLCILLWFFVSINLGYTQSSRLSDHRFEWISPDTVNTALDGFPKFKVRVTNNGASRSPDRLGVSFTSPDYDGVIGGFANFPNGGHIKLEPAKSMIVSIWSQGVKERAITDKKDDGSFTRNIGFKFLVDDFNNRQEQIVSRNITFIDWDKPVRLEKISGPMQINGIVPPDTEKSPLSENQPRETRVYVKTPNSELIQVAAGTSDQPLAFQTSILSRDDWYPVVDQPSYQRYMVRITAENASNIPITRREIGSVIPQYEFKLVVQTPTGFWRGAVSEQEKTFVVFPGQENWMQQPNSYPSVFKRASVLYKYTFEGNLVWQHETDWEVWGGDMTPDGSLVAYVENPAPGPKVHKMVVLDGISGQIYWEIGTSSTEAFTQLGRTLESVAVELSDDGNLMAVGTSASGMVTLYDIANKKTLWSFPDESYEYTSGFGQIREMRFSEDNKYLYIGAGDSFITKLRLEDKKIVWRAYTGAWPFVNGLNFSPDKRYLYTGTKSYDLTKIDAETGEIYWQIEPQFFDAELSKDGKMIATFGGKVYDTESGSFLGKGGDRTHLLDGGNFMIGVNKEVTTYDIAGKIWFRSESSGIGECGGCQVQWSYLSNDERYLIVAARDMTDNFPIPGPGIAIYERVEGTYLSFEHDQEIPANFKLDQNYPNQFNPTTSIPFQLPYEGIVTIKLFNSLGQQMKILQDGVLSVGQHNITINATNLASGVYFYTISFEGQHLTRKMMLLK